MPPQDTPERISNTRRPILNPIDPRNPLARIYLVVLLFDLAEGALRFLVPVYLDTRGYGPGAIGIATAAFAVASLASRLPAGLAYRPDRAYLLILGAGAASALAFAAAPFTTSIHVFTLLMAMDGLGWGIATTSLLTVVMRTKPPEISEATAMGWYVGFNGLGIALASVVGGLLGDWYGVRSAMLMLASVPFLAAALISWRLPTGEEEQEVAQPVHEDTVQAPALTQRLRLAIQSLPTPVWVAALTALYLNVMNNILNSFFPLVGLALGFSLAQVGTLSGIRSGVSALARFTAGAIFARTSARKAHTPLLIVSALTTACVPSIASYVLQMPIWAANGISRGLLRVSTGAEALETTPAGREGLSAGVMSAGLDVGKILGPLIGGAVAEAVGIGNMFRIVPLTFLVIFVFSRIAVRRHRTHQADPVRA